MPYVIKHHPRGSSKTTAVIVPNATEAERSIRDLERRNEIIDSIIDPYGKALRLSQLHVRADNEKSAHLT